VFTPRDFGLEIFDNRVDSETECVVLVLDASSSERSRGHKAPMQRIYCCMVKVED
jgi:hypothetical protein